MMNRLLGVCMYLSGIDEITFSKEIKCPRFPRKPDYWVVALRNGRRVFLLIDKYQIEYRGTHAVLYSDMVGKLKTIEEDDVRYITCSNECLEDGWCHLTIETEPQLFKRVIQTVRYYLEKEGHGITRE